ncbi:EpsG family protein [Clostridium butyricum]|uniref:EpsG family protein n=1 Tax=Clostridium butyricum TaxID=1492 RepID=UPI002ABDC9C2|nr:EpsG family protein [Clostridium butyricum]
MVVYLFIFFLSLIFIYTGQVFEVHKKNSIGKILYIIGILIPSILAGLRDYSVGTDVKFYGVPMFESAIGYSNFNNYLSSNSEAVFSEPLYNLMNFIISRFTSNPFWILFFISLIINTFIFLGWYKCKNKTNLYFGMFVFYFTYYNMSLNMMRQCISMSIIFYAFNFISEKKVKKYYVLVLIAIGFHTSSIIAIIFYPFCWIINKNLVRKYSKIINPIIILSVGLCIIFIFPITRYLVSIGLIRENYMNYLSGDLFGSSFSFKAFVMGIFEIIIVLLPYKYIKQEYSKYNHIVLISIIGFIFNQLTFISNYINRISFYFLFIRLYLYGIIPYLFKNKKIKYYLYFV